MGFFDRFRRKKKTEEAGVSFEELTEEASDGADFEELNDKPDEAFSVGFPSVSVNDDRDESEEDVFEINTAVDLDAIAEETSEDLSYEEEAAEIEPEKAEEASETESEEETEETAETESEKETEETGEIESEEAEEACETESKEEAEEAAETESEEEAEEAAETESEEEAEETGETESEESEEACETESEEAEEAAETDSEEETEEAPAKREGFFARLKNGLKKTRDGFVGKVEQLINSFTRIDEDFFEELEETLILSDIGAETSEDICEKLRAAVKRTGAKDPADVKKLLRGIIAEMLTGDNELHLDTKPSVIMVIGVNGAGKTTTIGKLAANLKQSGKKVIIAAADTFRAAAIDQLAVWAQRAGADFVKHSEGSDPASVVFDAIAAAKARGADVVLCDTAGRLHNKKNLMEELKKIARVVTRELPDASVETLLVLDATTGQNAVSQARLFSESADITGIALTKLDGTAKGGIIIPIKNELDIPVKLVGVGEKIEDLQPFVPADYVGALFD